MKSTSVIPFIYGVSIVCGASGNNSGTITCNQDASFELHFFGARSSIDYKQYDGATWANTEFADTFTALVTEQTTGRQLMNQKVHQRVLCAPSNKSISERRPVIFPPGTVFTIDLTNLIAVSNTVDFYLKGYKVFSPLK